MGEGEGWVGGVSRVILGREGEGEIRWGGRRKEEDRVVAARDHRTQPHANVGL